MPALTLPAGVDQLVVVNDFIAQHLPVGHEKIRLRVELVLEELLVNIFRYAYNETSGVAELGCREVNLDGKPHFCVSVRDYGAPFDPFLEASMPDISQPLEERQPGGLGVRLVKHVAAHYCYSGSDDSNTIELYFPLEKI